MIRLKEGLSKREYQKAKELAENHWQFLERWLHMVFVDGFIHGYKHALEERRKRRNV